MNSTINTYDLAILGGGPAGAAAAVYAARKRLKSVLITSSWGGQSIDSAGIENWIGTVKISGSDLARSLEAHVRAYAGDIIDIKDGEYIKKTEKIDSGFLITTDSNTYKAKTVLITTGSHRKKIEAKNADKFEHKGLTYCATCDGPLFANQDVIVIGGGNAALESAVQLAAYCKSVTLVQRSRRYRADETTVQKVLQDPKIKSVTNVNILEIVGDKFVTGMKIQEKESGKESILNASGIFVEIGSIPTVDFVKDLVKLNETGHVITDPRTQKTSVEGVWSAGDCTDGLYHQNNIAVGDAVKALEDIYYHLHTK